MTSAVNDFDETYIHSSYEHSYQNKVLSENNVDFLVKSSSTGNSCFQKYWRV